MNCQTHGSQSIVQKCLLLLCLAFVLNWPGEALAQIPAIPKFAIQYWDVPNRTGAMTLFDMNRSGQIVGYYADATGESHAFLYSPSVNRQTAFDFAATFGGAGVPEGWKYKEARDINDQGIILGVLTTIDPTLVDPVSGKRPVRGFILDTRVPSPSIVLLPELVGISQYHPYHLNNDGDIVGRYWAEDGGRGFFFFNPAEHENLIRLDPIIATADLGERIDGIAMVGGQVNPRGTTVYRCIPELGVMNVVSNITNVWFVNGMNDNGSFVCWHQSVGPRPGRIVGDKLETLAPYNQAPLDINNSNDVVLTGGYLYRDDRGAIALKLYLSGSKADLATWNSTSTVNLNLINDRDSVSKYGVMAGQLDFYVNGVNTRQQPFTLTPIAKRR